MNSLERLQAQRHEIGILQAKVRELERELARWKEIATDVAYGKWIPVEERLPEENTLVLLESYEPGDGKYMDVAYYEGEYFFRSRDAEPIDSLWKRWMPIPEGP